MDSDHLGHRTSCSDLQDFVCSVLVVVFVAIGKYVVISQRSRERVRRIVYRGSTESLYSIDGVWFKLKKDKETVESRSRERQRTGV